MTEPIRLDGKVAVVTGAGSGMGREAMRIMAERGAALVAVDRDAEALTRLAEVLPADARWIAVTADMADEAAAAGMVASARAEFGRIDILFNAASLDIAEAAIGDIAGGDFQRVFTGNATAVFLTMKHVIPVMAQGGGGAIVNRSSLSAYAPDAGQAALAAASAAVMGMTRTAALEWGEAGIRVNCINPGPAASHVDAALLAAFLASDEASFVTGAIHAVGAG